MINKSHIQIGILMCLMVSAGAHAIAWNWSIDNTSSTFTGTETETSNVVSGTFTRLENGFIEMDIDAASGPNVPSLGTKIYPVEVPGFFISFPPILDFETQMSVNVESGGCPGVTTVYNWVFSGWSSSNNMTSATQAAFGSMTWDVSGNTATIDNLYNVTSFGTPSWWPGALNLDTSVCAGGVTDVLGPANTDRAGDMYLSSNGGLVYSTEANNIILGLPQQQIVSVGSLSGLYGGYLFRYDNGATVEDNIKPFRVWITPQGHSRGDVLSDISVTTRDTGYGTVRFDVTNLNAPEDGMLQGTLTRGLDSGLYGCVAYNTGVQNVIACAGQADDENTSPANLILVEQTLPSAGPFTCDSGAFNTTCNVNSAKVLADGEFIVANNIVIQNGGSITSAGEVGIEMVGDMTIENGGSFSANVGEMIIREFSIESGGSFSGNIAEGHFNSVTIASGASLNADGRGFTGATAQDSGLGSGGGNGHDHGSGSGSASGASHAASGGQGNSVTANATTYGSTTAPVDLGSGGGSGEGNTAGGNGGGQIKMDVEYALIVNGTMSVDGNVGANGSNATSLDAAGGGAGGSIWIDVGTLGGTGTITAGGGAGGNDGATGSDCGGGGSGGRLSIKYDSAWIAGSNASASGGIVNCNVATSATAGGAGSVHWDPVQPDDPDVLPVMVLWLDAEDQSTILDENGRTADHLLFTGSVATWEDKSGSANTHHFTASSGQYPAFSPLTGDMSFDGSADRMTTSNHAEINTATVDQRNITVAFKTSSTLTGRQMIFEEGGGSRGMNIYMDGSTLYCGFWNRTNDGDGVQNFVSQTTTLSANETYFVTFVFDYTNYVDGTGPLGSLECFVNNASIGSASSTSLLYSHSGAVGLGNVHGKTYYHDGVSTANPAHAFEGDILELMYFNSPPSSADVTTVHNYLEDKWNN